MATEVELIQSHVDEQGICLLTFNRPQRMNAVTGQMLDELEGCVGALNANPLVKVVILTGAGKAFCAGRDRDELGGVAEQDRHDAIPQSGGHHSDMIRRLQMPTIAAVNGAAVGAGLGFVLQCDIRIASQQAFFYDGHLSAGMSPSISSWYLPRLCGVGAALQVFCQLDRVPAAQAQQLGMVSEVVEADQLISHVQSIASGFARWDSEVLRHTKALATAALEENYDRNMERVGLLRGLHARGH